jgi:hypothetical protein
MNGLMKKLFRILLAATLSFVLASVAAVCIGLMWQSVGLAVLVFVTVFVFALWRSLKTPSVAKAAGKSLQLTGLLLVALPFSIVAACFAAAAGTFGAGSGYAGGAIALGLIALVAVGFIIFLPAGAAAALLGTYLRLKKQRPGPDTPPGQDF